MKTLILISALAVASLTGCQSGRPQTDEYTLVRPATRSGAVSNEALYTRAGDTNHVYIKSLDGSSFIPMPR